MEGHHRPQAILTHTSLGFFLFPKAAHFVSLRSQKQVAFASTISQLVRFAIHDDLVFAFDVEHS